MTTKEIEIDGKIITIETGRMAKQANGSVFVTCQGSSVLATICCSDSIQEDLDYVPLSVEYNEKYYAAGKIPGGFLKREGRPRDKEILVSRLIDRPIRPLLYKEFKRDIQLIPTTLSTDQINPPDIIAMIASFCALSLSDIPFDGPCMGLRICYLNDKFIMNPTFAEIKRSSMELVVAGTKDGITMVEGGASEVSEEIVLQALDLAKAKIKDLCIELEGFISEFGKTKIAIEKDTRTFVFTEQVKNDLHSTLSELSFIDDKLKRKEELNAKKNSYYETEINNKLKDHIKNTYPEQEQERQFNIEEKLYFNLIEDIIRDILRKSILDNNLRIDKRNSTDIRDITCEINILPKTHGSALFTRGQTQSLGVITLGSPEDEKIQDDIDGECKDSFLLHYNFPPFSVGETGRLMTGRREIGHGHLAFRALENLVPSKENFSYTIRFVSEILESNGSSSMATVCSGSLAMMAAGIPIKKPVAGIAMGLISENDKVAILSDILGDEDHLGDMDFKVAGTKDGITALQMDIKINNVSTEILGKALNQAKQGREHILNIMNSCISESNTEMVDSIPKIMTFEVNKDKLGSIIGSGGKNIKNIFEKYGVKVSVSDSGVIALSTKENKNALEKAKKEILNNVSTPQIGDVYEGLVKKIVDFGAFVEFLPEKEGLCHISKMSNKRIAKVEDVLKLHQKANFKIISITNGKIQLALEI